MGSAQVTGNRQKERQAVVPGVGDHTRKQAARAQPEEAERHPKEGERHDESRLRYVEQAEEQPARHRGTGGPKPLRQRAQDEPSKDDLFENWSA